MLQRLLKKKKSYPFLRNLLTDRSVKNYLRVNLCIFQVGFFIRNNFTMVKFKEFKGFNVLFLNLLIVDLR